MREKRRNLDPKNIKRIRTFRTEMSESEKKLYDKIRDRKLGYKFLRQHPIGPYALDFYCSTLKLCIEVDGEQHLLTKERDAKRDAFLAEYGILTIRIPSLELFGENDIGSQAWANRIKEICDARWQELHPDKKVPERRNIDD